MPYARHAAVAALLFASSAQAQFTFTEIATADLSGATGTPIPNGTGNFTGLASASVANDGTVAFRGFGSSLQQGVYLKTPSAALALVANKANPSGTPGPFSSGVFGPVVSNNGTVAFLGAGTSQRGVYVGTSPAALTTVADKTTDVPPSLTEDFTNFNGVAISGSTVAFSADGPSQTGIYTGSSPANIARVIDSTMTVQGGTGTYTSLGNVAIDGSTVSFRAEGTDGEIGIYKGSAGGAVTRVADLSPTIVVPGTVSSNFTDFGYNTSISGGVVAFRGEGSNGESGVYTGSSSTTLVRVADLTTVAPDSGGQLFTAFPDLVVGAGVAISGTTVAFTGTYNDGVDDIVGIYYKDGAGQVMKLITAADVALTDPLGNGKAIESLSLGEFGLNGTYIVFLASFTDSTQGIYSANLSPVPEPGLVLGLAAAGLGGARLLRRRSRASTSVVA